MYLQRITTNRVFLTLILTTALPLVACDKDETPTTPTQPGPTVAGNPTPTPTDTRPIISLTGVVANLSRSGPGDLDVAFRIDDFTIVHASSGTPVTSGSMTGQTDFLRNGQTVTAEGRRTGEFLDATHISIDKQAPQ